MNSKWMKEPNVTRRLRVSVQGLPRTSTFVRDVAYSTCILILGCAHSAPVSTASCSTAVAEQPRQDIAHGKPTPATSTACTGTHCWLVVIGDLVPLPTILSSSGPPLAGEPACRLTHSWVSSYQKSKVEPSK